MKKSVKKYMKILVSCRFLDQIRLQNCFWTNIERKKLLTQYFNNLQFTKTFADNICILSLKKSKMIAKAFFMNMTKQNNTFFYVLVCSKVLFLAILKHTKTFLLAKCFIIYYVIFMNTVFLTIFFYFFKDKAHVVRTSFCKYFKY